MHEYKTRYFRRGNYFAFYIDLLGQKDFYSHIPEHGFITDASVQKELVVISAVVTKIISYASAFLPKFVVDADSAYTLNNKAGYSKYNSMDVETYRKAVRSLEYGAQQFSDSMIFYLRDDNLVAGDVFPFCIALLSRLAMEYFPNGLSFRGSVSYGEGWEAGKDIIDGKILKRLMELEEREAIVPRIIVDDALVNYCRASMKGVNETNYLQVNNLAGTMMNSFYQDEDGSFALDVFNEGFFRSLQESEVGQFKDLLVASCKFLHDQYRRFVDKQRNASNVTIGANYASVAFKYARAYAQYKKKLPVWGLSPNLDFKRDMPEYQPVAGNYAGQKAELAEYTVVRLSFRSIGPADNELKQSRMVNRANRMMHMALDWLRYHVKELCDRAEANNLWGNSEIGEMEQYVLGKNAFFKQIANVSVLGLKNGKGDSECLMLILSFLSVLIPRLMGRGIFVSGSIVSANGWVVADNCLCGPVMQKSYEVHKKLSESYRIVLDRDVVSNMVDAIRRIREKLAIGADLWHPNLEDCIGTDSDGVKIFNYAQIYRMCARASTRRKLRYNADLRCMCKSVSDVSKGGVLSRQERWGFTLVKDYVAIITERYMFNC